MKKYDIAVKVGSYEKNGEIKNQWENVGAVIEGRDGGLFMTLKKTFNPAGLVTDHNKDSITMSLFEPRDRQQGGYQQPQQSNVTNINAPADPNAPPF